MNHGHLKKWMGVPGFLLCFLFSAAQPGATNKPKTIDNKARFAAITTAGLQVGASVPAFQVQASAGLQQNGWFAGLGTGIDYYYLRSVPLFAEVRKLFQKPMPFFLYAAAGINKPWIKEETPQFNAYTSGYKSGGYFEAGCGWYVSVLQHHALLLSAGYSIKTIHENRIANWDPHSVTKNTYDLRRVSIKAGFWF
jgi:hypothetical protein